jgi:voltage-gated potassium channel
MLKAIKNKQTELTVSLGMILVLLTLASTLMYYLEHNAQPKSFENLYTSLWWGIDKYLTATGGEDINPITPAGKFLAGVIAILGVGMFALPAGIIASGFIEEIEKNKLQKELISLESKF